MGEIKRASVNISVQFPCQEKKDAVRNKPKELVDRFFGLLETSHDVNEKDR